MMPTATAELLKQEIAVTIPLGKKKKLSTMIIYLWYKERVQNKLTDYIKYCKKNFKTLGLENFIRLLFVMLC